MRSFSIRNHALTIAIAIMLLFTVSGMTSGLIALTDASDTDDGLATDVGADGSVYEGAISLGSASYSAGEGEYTFTWTYGTDTYTLSFDIDYELYEYYVDQDIERYMTTQSDEGNAVNFITAHDLVIVYIAEGLENLTEQSGLDSAEEAQLVLNFVQSSFPYSYDSDTHDMSDYWSFPVETLYEGTGDCEDKSFLYASIMESIGYETALLIYDDHVAVGVNCTGLSGWYYLVDDIRYYYCETTNTGWDIGEMPSGYNEANVLVIDGRPTVPVSLKAYAGDGEVTLTWQEPLSDGGSDIDYYIIYQDGVEIGTTTYLNYTVTGLTNDQMYRFSVAAHNQDGTGEVSDEVMVMPSAQVAPSAPLDLVAIVGDGYVTLTWSPPENEGTSTIDYYVIYIDGSMAQISIDTSVTISGLTDGETYVITVAAHSSAGVGEETGEVTVEITATALDDGSDGMLLVVIVVMLSMAVLVAVVYVSERNKRKHHLNQVAPSSVPPQYPPIGYGQTLGDDPSVRSPESPQPPMEDGPRFCSQCGSSLEGSAMFCSNCGNRVR